MCGCRCENGQVGRGGYGQTRVSSVWRLCLVCHLGFYFIFSRSSSSSFLHVRRGKAQSTAAKCLVAPIITWLSITLLPWVCSPLRSEFAQCPTLGVLGHLLAGLVCAQVPRQARGRGGLRRADEILRCYVSGEGTFCSKRGGVRHAIRRRRYR